MHRMRLIGYVAEEAAARTFGDYLFVEGIENHLEQEPKEGWGIWVSDEDKMAHASELLKNFLERPQDPIFRNRAKSAASLRAEKAKDESSYQAKLRNRRHLFHPLHPYGFGPLTFALITASAVVFFLSGYGNKVQGVMALFITDWSGGVVDATLPEIRHGQIWRVITPIFLHSGVMHIVFNMLWLRDLGSMIEARQSPFHLAVLVVVVATCSNIAQFYIGRDPRFGGMSGVVYGLLGYIWLRGKFDPGSGLYLHSSTVVMMIVWFFFCYTGFVGRIANTAHAVGLGMGLAWGYLSSLRHR
jgi:GlpG protein